MWTTICTIAHLPRYVSLLQAFTPSLEEKLPVPAEVLGQETNGHSLGPYRDRENQLCIGQLAKDVGSEL